MRPSCALAGLLAVFAEFERELLREQVKAGIAQARKKGRPHGREKAASRSCNGAGLSNGRLAG
jgi:DNA invertase Pin-like site-specific DNA recombinase